MIAVFAIPILLMLCPYTYVGIGVFGIGSLLLFVFDIFRIKKHKKYQYKLSKQTIKQNLLKVVILTTVIAIRFSSNWYPCSILQKIAQTTKIPYGFLMFIITAILVVVSFYSFLFFIQNILPKSVKTETINEDGKTTKTTSVNKKINLLEIAIVVLSMVFLIWRARYGFCFNDEPFCVTIAQKLFSGQKLLSGEWNLTQNIGVLIFPFYSIYRIINGSNEGVLLFLRYCYCILWFLTCFKVFRVLRKRYEKAIFVFLYLILFSPLDYMTLSYTSFGFMAILLLAALNYEDSCIKSIPAWRLGLSTAILSVVLVLASPYMAILYIICLGYAFYRTRSKENKKYKNATLINILVVLISVIIYFFAFVYSKDIGNILINVKKVFSDPRSQVYPIFVSLYLLIKNTYNAFPFVMWFASIVFVFSIFTPRYVKKYKTYIFFLSVFLMVAEYVKIIFEVYKNSISLNGQMLPVAIVGSICYILAENKSKQALLSFVFAGMAYIGVSSISSNTGLVAFCMASSILGAIGIISIFELANEIKKATFCLLPKKHVKAISVVAVVIVILSEMGTRIYRQYWDEPLPKLNVTITDGVAKNLKTCEKNNKKYETIYNNLKTLLKKTKTNKNTTFLSFSFGPYTYLDADLTNVSFSAWTPVDEGEYTKETLKNRHTDFIKTNNIKPDIVFYNSKEDIIDGVIDYDEYSLIEYNDAGIFVRKR